MDMKRRRSSSSITLVLISASALSACGQSSPGTDTLRRDIYTSQADCMKDWGADPAKCEPRRTGTGSSGYTHYYGPAYTHGSYGSSRSLASAGSTTEARTGSHATGTAHVSRGGFGSSSSSHGSSSGARASSSS
jgi:hypothetical protein